MTDPTPPSDQVWEFIKRPGVLSRYGLAFVDNKIVRRSCGRCVHKDGCLEIKIPCKKWEYKEADNESR